MSLLVSNLSAAVWLILLIAFLIAEAACPIHLVSIWFAAGSLVALLVSLVGAAVWLQVTLFILVSGVLLALLWPLAQKYMKPKLTATNVDALAGTVGIVVSPIDNVDAVGQVKLNGMEWSARSTTGESIPQGAKVRVDRVQGVKVFVTAVAVPEEAK